MDLTTEDYRHLYEMSISDDAPTRAEASALAKKLTPNEQQAFFDVQKQMHPQGEIGRKDNSVMGVPPEMAVMAPIAGARALAGVVGTGGKVAAGTKAAFGSVAPVVKYEATKTGLEKIGVPSSVATVIAAGVSGLTKSPSPQVSGPVTSLLSLADESRVKYLIGQGLSQADAIAKVLGKK